MQSVNHTLIDVPENIDLEKKSVAVISDALVHHAELMYSEDIVPSIASLCDLAELGQTAVTHDYLLTTQEAYKNSTLLGALDNVLVWQDDLRTTAEDLVAGRIDISANQSLVPACLAWAIRQDPILGRYFEPKQEATFLQRAWEYVHQFPAVMMLLMMHNGLPVLEEDAFNASKELEQTLQNFEKYAGAAINLAEKFCGNYVASVLEQPLLDLIRTDEPINGVENRTIRKIFNEEMDKAVESVRDLGLKDWHIPALGVYLLHMAKDLNTLPKMISRTREKLTTYRLTIVEKELERRRYIAEGKGGSLHAGLRELDKLERDICAAHEAMAFALNDGRLLSRSEKIDKRRETTQSGVRLLMSLAGATAGALSSGKWTSFLKPIDKLIDLLGLNDHMALLSKSRLVKGLYSAQSFFNLKDARTLQGVDAIAKRYLGQPYEIIHMQYYILFNALSFSRLMAAGLDPSNSKFDFGEFLKFMSTGRKKEQVDSRLAWVVYAKDPDGFARQFPNVREKS